MNEAREIFEVYYKDIMKYIILDLPDGDKKHNIKISQDTALKQLRELVEGKKQKEPEMDWGGRTYEEQIEPARISGYNSACDDIADMIYKEEK
jgi:hypothetical protein